MWATVVTPVVFELNTGWLKQAVYGLIQELDSMTAHFPMYDEDMSKWADNLLTGCEMLNEYMVELAWRDHERGKWAK